MAHHAGPLTWLSFAIAMVVVLLTALSYSELGSRFPKSGGVSIYIQEAFGCKWLSIFAGLLLLSATIFSMSTLSQAFVGYLEAFGLHVPHWFGVSGFLIILLLINMRGIKQSSIANIVSTAVEVSGLLIVLVCGFWYLSKSNNQSVITPVLTVFSFSCIALIKIKLKNRVGETNSKIFRIPMFVPWLAVALNMTAIAFLPTRSIIPAVVFIGVGLIISWVAPKNLST